MTALAECNGPDQLPDWCLSPVRRSRRPWRKPGPKRRLDKPVKVSIVLTDSLRQRIEYAARQEGVSCAQIIRTAAEEMLVARGLLPGVKPDASQTTT